MRRIIDLDSFFIMIGIYKITSPSGKVYIGQSRDIERRFLQYKNKHCKLQVRLYNSFNKYGVKNHTFEIIEECEITNLNEREYYWQIKYDVLGSNGLNCLITNPKAKVRIISEETREKMSKAQSKRERKFGKDNPNYGRKHPEETKKKIGDAQRGELNHMYGKRGDKHHSYGTKMPNEAIVKRRNTLKEKYKKLKYYEMPSAKVVIDLYTGVFYYSITDLAKLLKIDNSYLGKRLKSKSKNNYNERYVLT